MHAGILVIDKPAGSTSARVVADVKRRIAVAKVGHTGTLDPMATGVLPLVIGEATKIAGYLLAEDKEYEGTIALGVETDTLDAEGQPTGGDAQRANAVSRDDAVRAMHALTGELEQVPPMYSALKKNGVRLHELARRGEHVERPPRQVTVTRFELTEFERARIAFMVECSTGTYVRSLARDLGRALGCGAHLASLRRTRAGQFTAQDALAPDSLDDSWSDRLISINQAVAHIPAFPAPPALLDKLKNGLRLPWSDFSAAPIPRGVFRITINSSNLLAIARVDDGVLRYQRVFNSGLT